MLDAHGASVLGLPTGIPVAPAEGDQPAALAGSLIGAPGMVSMSFGTSVVANSVGDRAFQGIARGIDHFCAPDGRPINMVWLRNGTTAMNTVVEMFGKVNGSGRGDGFAAVMPQVLAAPDDCGGLLALPFMDDEPGLGVSRGGDTSREKGPARQHRGELRGDAKMDDRSIAPRGYLLRCASTGETCVIAPLGIHRKDAYGSA